jgi:hypothetical protein
MASGSGGIEQSVDLLEAVGLGGPLIGAPAGDARKAQGDA